MKSVNAGGRHLAFQWVSPYEPGDSRGGWKSMQYYLLRALEEARGPSRRLAPVEVPEEAGAKWVSRVWKKLGIPRSYAYYSPTRLKRYAGTVEPFLAELPGVPVVFFGALPFVACRPAAPYYMYTDGCFAIHYWEYNKDHSHRRADIERICREEAEFMAGSAGVWCSSQWLAERLTREYGLPAGLARFVGTGPGNVPAAGVGSVAGGRGKTVVMIAADFERKGGRLAVAAVAEANRRGAGLTLRIIGEKPPEGVMGEGFVEWCGWLDLRQVEDRVKFAEVLSEAGLHLLLSRNDLSPLAIPEASTYGVPTLATDVGAIGEMIRHGETGWVVPREADAVVVGGLLAEIFGDEGRLGAAGAAARELQERVWNWRSVAARCFEGVASGVR